MENQCLSRDKIALISQTRTGVIGNKQLGLSDYQLTSAKKQAKLETFLTEIEAAVLLISYDCFFETACRPALIPPSTVRRHTSPLGHGRSDYKHLRIA